MKKVLGIVMDPIGSIKPYKDTTLALMLAAQKRGWTLQYFELKDLWQPEHEGAQAFLDFLNGWVRLTNVLNELSRSMGQPDYYPFVLPHAAVGKLQFIHQLVAAQREAPGAAPVPVPQASDAPVQAPVEVEGPAAAA